MTPDKTPEKPVLRMSRFLGDNLQYWRERAEEMRAVAEDMKYPETRAIMLKIAEDYESLAKKAEIRGGETHP